MTVAQEAMTSVLRAALWMSPLARTFENQDRLKDDQRVTEGLLLKAKPTTIRIGAYNMSTHNRAMPPNPGCRFRSKRRPGRSARRSTACGTDSA